jgi:cytochrome c551/c552
MNIEMSFSIKFIFLLIPVVFVFSSCNQSKKNVHPEIAHLTESKPYNAALSFQLLTSNCFACHSPNPEIEVRVAPSMAEIKSSYISKYQQEEAFIQQMTEFLSKPLADKSLMPAAVEQYGIMPKMEFSASDLNQIARYLHRTPLENENWYTDDFPNEKIKYAIDENELGIEQRGLKLAMATKGVLGKNLLKAIQDKGTSGALSFCNTRAIPLTDSMSNEMVAHIKRVSDFNRNPANKANFAESSYIQNGRTLLAAGSKLMPKVIEEEDKYISYYPIMTTELCLQCHGIPEEDIQPDVLETIISLYPTDRAMGFKEGDLRGIWVIEMAKDK